MLKVLTSKEELFINPSKVILIKGNRIYFSESWAYEVRPIDITNIKSYFKKKLGEK